MTTRDERLRRQRGQALVEYALALATIVLVVVAGTEALRNAWSNQMQMTADGLSAESITTN